MKTSKLGKAKLALFRQKDRLHQETPFKVSILIAPFLVVTVLTAYTSLETATRLYSVGQPLEHLGAPAGDHAIWLSIGAKDDRLFVTTINGQMFSWPLAGPSKKERAELDIYLHQQAQKLVTDATLQGQVENGKNTVGLSVDQHLTFLHVRPVLYALAEAGFSKYGFETRIVR
jgi:hypothetical protein